MRRLLLVLSLVAGLGLAFAIAVAPAGVGSPAALTKPTKRTTTTLAATTTTVAQTTTTTLAATTTTVAPTTTIAPTTTVADTTTTTEAPTTTTAPTTTVAPTTTTTGPPPPPPLRYSRDTIIPGWQDYTQVHVGGLNTTVVASGNTRVICDSPLQKRLILQASVAPVNIAVIGCEINITDPALSDDDRNAVWMSLPDTTTGVVWFEGVLFNSAPGVMDDGFTGSAASMDVYVQNSLANAIYGGSADHSDCIQPWSGFHSFTMDMFTCHIVYQGTMLKADWNQWQTTTYGRVNLTHLPEATPDCSAGCGWLLNWVTGSAVCNGVPNAPGCNNTGDPYVTGPLHFGSEFYIAPRGNLLANDMGVAGSGTTLSQFFTITGDTSASGSDGLATPVQPNVRNVVATGVVREGGPPTPSGDYVVPSDVGQGYIPPG